MSAAGSSVAAVNAAGASPGASAATEPALASGRTGGSEAAHALSPPSPRALVEAAWASLHTPEDAATPPPAPRTEPIAPPAAAYVPPPTTYAYASPTAPPPAPAPRRAFAVRAAPVLRVSMGPLISQDTVRQAQHMVGNDPALAEHVQAIAAYDDTMRAALMMPDFTGTQDSARRAAIANARARLAAASRRRLTPAAVERIDVLLGLPKTDPALGVD